MKEKELAFSDVPNNFLWCINRQCSKAETCLRQLAERLSPEELISCSAINPKHLTFLTHFSELSHRFSRWTFNISLLSQLVKGICAIFLYNFQLYFPTTKCAYFFCISLYFVVNKKIAVYRCFHPLPAICFNYIY